MTSLQGLVPKAGGRFRRLGLQRRIMLYVAIGLGLMLAIGVYLGDMAIQQATQLIYQERLAIASTTAATMDLNLQEMVYEVTSVRNRLLSASSAVQMEEIGGDLFQRMSVLSPFPFVRAQGLWLVDSEGQVRMAFPKSTAEANGLYTTKVLPPVKEPTLLAPVASPEASGFGTLLVPLAGDAGMPGWVMVVELAGLNGDTLYLIPPSSSAQDPKAAQDSPNAYRMEVLSPGGAVALSRGGETPPGNVSAHYLFMQQQTPERGTTSVFLHWPKKDQNFAPHMITTVPLSFGNYQVLLEQREDVALALPLRLRQRLILFAGVGFLATLLVAWVTTRHVVKPTEQLTMAAQRIAQGQVEPPISVAAQDEIGTLAESLEIMRRRLQAWGSELEKQVDERTRELQRRNQELGDLYDTLQPKEEQLRTLLGKVLTAQEDERKRVSRELHDGIGQALSAISMGLERLGQARPGQVPDIQGQVETLKELTASTLSDLRSMTVALRPAALDDLGLVPAIRRYAELHLVNAGVDFTVEDEGLPERLGPALETVVFRVVQEAINNVARHSRATEAKIRLLYDKGTLTVRVEDNGMGFHSSVADLKEGLGLQGMQERASLVSGKLTVESHPGHGTMVMLEVPLAEGVSISGHG